MAYLFTAASSQYIIGNSCPVSGDGVTLSAWYKPTAFGINQAVICIGSDSGQGRYQLFVNPAAALVAQRINDSGSGENATAVGTLTAGAWAHCVATIPASGSAVTVWLNGVATVGTNNTGAALTIGAGRTLIGARSAAGSIGLFGNGDVAEVGVWNVVLGAADIAALYAGYKCRAVCPSALKFDCRLVRNIQDLSAGMALTNTNGVTVSPHARIIYP